MNAVPPSPVMNYFAYPTAAQRYARYRPYFHPRMMERIRQRLDLSEAVPAALDVGCGTGQSTVALLHLAREVIGADISAEMLAAAWRVPPLRYVRTPAETLPFPDAAFDLITVGVAFHWFDRSQFLPEAHRVLKPGGPLIVYNNGFGGASEENASLNAWINDVYQSRYPTPPRHGNPVTDEEATRYGFRHQGDERFADPFTLPCEDLAGYLTTQSNVIAAVEQGMETFESVFAWLVREMTPFFDGERLPFTFAGSVIYLQKEQGEVG